MLSEESVMILNAVNKMISRYKDRFLPTFEQKPIILPAMKEKSKKISEHDWMHEVSELRRQLNESRLKIASYEVMGDMLEEQYGIDL
jgi:hypothetical protein